MSNKSTMILVFEMSLVMWQDIQKVGCNSKGAWKAFKYVEVGSS